MITLSVQGERSKRVISDPVSSRVISHVISRENLSVYPHLQTCLIYSSL
jgi:hypothetical protein